MTSGPPLQHQPAFDASRLGIWTDPESFAVTRERIIEYAKATNDPIPAHLDGDMAPPVFAIVPVFASMMAPLLEIIPEHLLTRVVHGEQDFRFHRSITPGDNLVSRATMVGYEGSAKGTRSAVLIETRDASGELVGEQYVTSFFRGFDAGEKVGTLPPAHKLADGLRETAAVATVDQHIDDDQTFRYGPAAGDPMLIHLDESIARSAGLPGIIAHGLCTMAFASWALLTQVGGSDTTHLRRLAVRFSKMVLPGDDLSTRIWRTGSVDGATGYAFETIRGGIRGGEAVLTDGLAVIAD
jgi:acyl dehydratase